ncbi:MAG: hypothetical protein A4E57_00983 [Syntrophorhabdaceae bacterium PtaU1.Bin034]|nr:MAG: hypothetical protein A4E57_00983 [Syntrophorhabdaceae bacterium PtaU1.Bin034]
MAIFRARTSLRNSGFTLVELLVVVMLLAMFFTFASAKWNMSTKRGKEAVLEAFSINVSLIREEAVSNYENRVIQFDISDGKASVGVIDAKNGFVPTGDLALPEDYRIKDVVINGESFPLGKAYMTFHPSGMVDRVLLHLEGEKDFYSLIINPLTAKVTGEDGYIEEVTLARRNYAS